MSSVAERLQKTQIFAMSESVVIFSKSVLQVLIFLANMNSLDDFHDDSSILKRQLQFLMKFFGFSKFGVSVDEGMFYINFYGNTTYLASVIVTLYCFKSLNVQLYIIILIKFNFLINRNHK